MAFDLENMTIDYNKMLRMIPSDRTTLAQSGVISDLISSLTPGQLVNLFPRYYRDQLPDVGKAIGSLGGVLSDPSRYVGGGGNDGGGTYSPFVPAPPSKTAQELAVEQILKENDITAKERISTVSASTSQILATIRGKESGGNYTIDNLAGASSASGAFQFTKGTWQGLTKQFGIGTEYTEAKFAPPDIQDKIAEKYIEDILRRHNGDVSWVPREWFAGPDGVFSAKEQAANPGQSVEGYVNDWMNRYAKNSDIAAIESSADNIKKLEELQAELVPLSEDVRKQLDPKTLELYDKAGPEQKWNIEQAITAVGVEKFNERVKDIAKTTSNLDETAKLISEGAKVNIDEDVMLGKKPFIEGNDFAVPIFTNAKNGQRFDENLSNLTPQAIERLKQQAIAAKAAGLTKLELYGAQTHEEHVSHGAGTETDVVGYNEDGSTWNRDQRAMTALGAVKLGGANRIGLYASGIGLHTGMADEAVGGPTAEGAWGAGGTSNVPIENFAPGLERELAAYIKGAGPMPESPALNEHLKRMQERIEQERANPAVSDPVTAAQNNMQQPEPQQPTEINTLPVTPVAIPPVSQQTQPATTSAGGSIPQAQPDAPLPPTSAPITVPNEMPTVPVQSFINGGSVKMPPGENIAAYNTNTDMLEFVSNDRELYTKDDQGNLRIDPSTIRQEDQKAEIASAEPQRVETPNQAVQRRPEQPMTVSTLDPNFVDTMSSGSMASSPSQLRALNRAKLYGDNSGNLVNGHFS